MVYVALLIVVVSIIVITNYYTRQKKLKKELEKLRKAWGVAKDGHFDFDNVARYANTTKSKAYHRLTEQTLLDIDFYALFAFVDRTTSNIGQQYLFKRMAEPTESVSDESPLINTFTTDDRLREKVQQQLLKLRNPGAYFVSALMSEQLLARPKWYYLAILNVCISVVLMILAFKLPVLSLVLIAPVALSMFIHYWNKNNTFLFLSSFPQLNNLIDVSRVLVRTDEQLYDTSVERSIDSLKSFQREVKLIELTDGGGIQAELSAIARYLLQLLKAIFLVEFFALYSITRKLEAKRDMIATLFEYVGGIDCCLSIASLRAGAQKTCVPVLTSPMKELKAKSIYHPLIDQCVKNDLWIKNKSVLITGSNMSGKTTFLRTLMVNSIMAQTLHTCFADEFVSPVLKQFSSIRISDDLFEGRSYYFQEVHTVASLIEQVKLPHQNLFILDEVFKGTNTIERIAAAKAILTYLNQGQNIVVVSTHDIALASMLEDEYDLYHFSETVENEQLHFDYQLKHGELRTRNAIRILELTHYPAEIIEEARRISIELNVDDAPPAR